MTNLPNDHTPIPSIGFLAMLPEQWRGQAIGILKALLYANVDRDIHLIRNKEWVIRDFSLLDQGIASNYAVNGNLPLCGVGLTINEPSNHYDTHPVVFLYKASETSDLDVDAISPMRVLTPRERNSAILTTTSFAHQQFFVQLFWLKDNQIKNEGKMLLAFPSSLITE